MKLVMTLLVRDEEDIVEANIEFHRAMGVDYFIVTDNLSSDRTAEILHAYAEKGILHYIFESEDNYAQHAWVTRMARMAAAEFEADWIINNDADEFWWPDDGDLKTLLGSVDPNIDAVAATRANFVPCQMSADSFFADVMTIREHTSVNALGKPLPPKVCHRAAEDIEVTQGNHSVRRDGKTLTAAPSTISIFHFPLRTYSQFENKIAKGGAAYERNVNLNERTGETWRYLYDLWKHGQLQSHYLQQVPAADTVRNRLRSGQYVRDERLKTFFATRKSLAGDSAAGAQSHG